MRLRTRGTKYAVLAVAAIALSACGGNRHGLDVSKEIVDRIKLGNELLFVDRAEGTVFAVEVMNDKPQSAAKRIDIPANPLVAVERPGAKEVLVLCAGQRNGAGDSVESPALVAINEKHDVRRYELTTPLSKIEVSADGSYALLYAPDTGSGATELLSDPNRVALVHLSEKPSKSNPFERTLKASGGAVTTVHLTAPMKLGDSLRHMALFTFGNGLSVWDLEHPDRSEIASEGLGAGGTVTFRRIVEDPDHATLYFIQQGLTDLRVLALDNTKSGRSNDFWPSWNQLPLDSQVASDLVLYKDKNDEPRVLVASQTQIRIIDANDSRVTAVSATEQVQYLHSFVGGSPNDTEQKQRVLAWKEGARAVTFVELTDLESRGSRNFEVVSLGSTLSRIVPLSATKVLTEFSSGGIGTLDLGTRRFTPLSSSGSLTSALIESDSKRVWVGANGDQRIAFFEPDTVQTGSVRLDATVGEMFIFERGTKRKVVVSHEDALGKITVIDAVKPSRSTATVLEGFLLDGVVER